MSKTSTVRIIGLMSGTSLDGLDMACIEFSRRADSKVTNWEWVATECVDYCDKWKHSLQNAHLLSAQELLQLDAEYGVYLGEKVQQFLKLHDLEKIDAIASHGHTVFHQPGKGFTLQIGKGENIQKESGIKVISDFRSQDVGLGGQGAPLVPIGDQQLFSEYDACINLGGFANISYQNSAGKRVAFDICPVNYVLNHFANKLHLPYDKEGEIAENGEVDLNLLNQLNALDFYHLDGPKSLGREWVEEEIFPLLKESDLSLENIIATFTKHTIDQISEVINHHNFEKVLLSGGGALNNYIVQSIGKKVQSEIIVADSLLLNYKEALVFAFLGYLKLNSEINVLKSVTGASRDSSSGVVYE